jgi:hypothetical protein
LKRSGGGERVGKQICFLFKPIRFHPVTVPILTPYINFDWLACFSSFPSFPTECFHVEKAYPIVVVGLGVGDRVGIPVVGMRVGWCVGIRVGKPAKAKFKNAIKNTNHHCIFFRIS